MTATYPLRRSSEFIKKEVCSEDFCYRDVSLKIHQIWPIASIWMFRCWKQLFPQLWLRKRIGTIVLGYIKSQSGPIFWVSRAELRLIVSFIHALTAEITAHCHSFLLLFLLLLYHYRTRAYSCMQSLWCRLARDFFSEIGVSFVFWSVTLHLPNNSSLIWRSLYIALCLSRSLFPKQQQFVWSYCYTSINGDVSLVLSEHWRMGLISAPKLEISQIITNSVSYPVCPADEVAQHPYVTHLLKVESVIPLLSGRTGLRRSTTKYPDNTLDNVQGLLGYLQQVS